MLELHHPVPMPHAPISDHLPSLSTMGSWTLPQLTQYPREPIRPTWIKESAHEPLTPPTTTQMDHHAIVEAPSYTRGSRFNPLYNDYHSAPSIPQLQSIQRIESPQSQRRPSNGYDVDSPQRSTTITPALSIPNTVQSPQKDISALAAETTCLFWFETGHTLSLIERRSLTASSPLQISPNVIPTPEFRAWVADLLSTTQVAPQVVLLGLLFIHRLKMRNPTVQGQLGSEYRLLTVALMLGNKFLDDNTYTNKTWAEVSHIKLAEVHLMEMEFLSNMRYNLFTTETEWKDWHVKLGRFGTCVNNYIKSRELASKLRMAASLRSTVSHQSPAVLPMPPMVGPQFTSAQCNNILSRTITPVLLPQISSNAISSIGLLPEPDLRGGLKRVLDDSPGKRPAKRRLPEFPSSRTAVSNISQSSAMTSAASSRVSLPSLVIPPFSTFNNSAPITPTSLPMPGTHAMALVYPSSQPRPQSDYHMNVTPIQANQPVEHIRQLSPYPPSSGHSSPVGASFSNNNYSPSYYLARRSSPYRPVRGVQHLLANQGTPPAFHAPRRVGVDQMQYHSLGQPLTERHVGHLPYIQHQHLHQPWSQSLPQPAWTVQS